MDLTRWVDELAGLLELTLDLPVGMRNIVRD